MATLLDNVRLAMMANGRVETTRKAMLDADATYKRACADLDACFAAIRADVPTSADVVVGDYRVSRATSGDIAIHCLEGGE